MQRLKQWVLSRQFVKDVCNRYYLDGLTKAQADLQVELEEIRRTAFTFARKDLEESMVETTEERVEELANKKLNDLLSKVDLTKLVSIDKQKGILFVGGVKADDLTLSNLKSEAEFFEASNLWKVLYETPKELAQRAMFVSGESLDDMTKGRSMLYLLASQKNIIDILKSYQPKK